MFLGVVNLKLSLLERLVGGGVGGWLNSLPGTWTSAEKGSSPKSEQNGEENLSGLQ